MSELLSTCTTTAFIKNALEVLKFADLYDGVCVGKFAYDVLSCLNTGNYSQVLNVTHTMDIEFLKPKMVLLFIKKYDKLIKVLGNNTFKVNINLPGAPCLLVRVLDKVDNCMFYNYDCYFDIKKSIVVSDIWPESRFIVNLKNKTLYLTRYGHSIFMVNKLPQEYLSYTLVYSDKVVNGIEEDINDDLLKSSIVTAYTTVTTINYPVNSSLKIDTSSNNFIITVSPK